MSFYVFGQNNRIILFLPSPIFTWWSHCSLCRQLHECRVTPVFTCLWTWSL